jgi:hypothetical protein
MKRSKLTPLPAPLAGTELKRSVTPEVTEQAIIEVPEALAPYITELSFAIDGISYRITRRDNFGYLLKVWVVVCHTEFYLCHSRWEYKAYQGFNSPITAWAALLRSPWND